jgi:hypothetical protein
VVTVVPTTAYLRQTVVASVARSSLPRGDHLRSASVSWGDGSKPTTLTSLASRATHSYAHAGPFVIVATLTDTNGQHAAASVKETVTGPLQGNYSGSDHFGHTDSFYVASGGTALHNAYIANTSLTCTVGTDSVANANYLTIPTVPVAASGAFSTTSSTSDLVAGEPATIADVFRGNIESLATDGHERAAGTYRETITFTDTSLGTCTTNDVPWFLERDTQPTQTTASPPDGGYSGSDYFGHTTSLVVAAGGTALNTVSVANTYLTCSVNTDNVSGSNNVTITSGAIDANGAFSVSSSTPAVVHSENATIDEVFSGSVESLAPDGHERSAGTYRETITFTDTSLGACTTNDVPWTVESS